MQEIVEPHILCKMLLNVVSSTGLDTKTIVTNVIVPIIVAIISIFLGKESYFPVSWNSGIEYSCKSFKQQNRSRNTTRILLTFQMVGLGIMYMILYFSAYRLINKTGFKIRLEDIEFLIRLGLWHFPNVITLYCILLKKQSYGNKGKGATLMRLVFSVIVLMIVVFKPIITSKYLGSIFCAIIGVAWTVYMINTFLNTKKEEYVKWSELRKAEFKAYILLHLFFFIIFFLGFMAVIFMQDDFFELIIQNKNLWFFILLLFTLVVALIWLMYHNHYDKMANIAFIYYQEKDGKKIYIYRKEGNQFLCANKEYLQCERKAFDDKIRKLQGKIEEKDWTDDNKKKELNKYIDRLKPYSNFVRIDKGEGKECIEPLEIYVNIFIDIIKAIRKIEDKQNIDTEIEIKLKRLKKCRQLYEENLIGQGKKILREFQEMTAIKFIPEDEVMKQTLYPVVEHYQMGFFKKL